MIREYNEELRVEFLIIFPEHFLLRPYLARFTELYLHCISDKAYKTRMRPSALAKWNEICCTPLNCHTKNIVMGLNLPPLFTGVFLQQYLFDHYVKLSP